MIGFPIITFLVDFQDQKISLTYHIIKSLILSKRKKV